MGQASQDDPAGSHPGVCSPEAPAQGTEALGGDQTQGRGSISPQRRVKGESFGEAAPAQFQGPNGPTRTESGAEGVDLVRARTSPVGEGQRENSP